MQNKNINLNSYIVGIFSFVRFFFVLNETTFHSASESSQRCFVSNFSFHLPITPMRFHCDSHSALQKISSSVAFVSLYYLSSTKSNNQLRHIYIYIALQKLQLHP